jgi:hypothetical protein
MRRFGITALGFLIVYFAAAPLLACIVPLRAMTAQERACCKKMARMCGSAEMPQTHSCCKSEVRPLDAVVASSSQQLVGVLSSAAAAIAPVSPQKTHCFHGSMPDHPPAGYVPHTTVLRI